MQHVPSRKKFSGFDQYHTYIPDVLDEVDLIKRLGTQVLGITLNGVGIGPNSRYRDALARKTSIPVVIPMIETMDQLYQILS